MQPWVNFDMRLRGNRAMHKFDLTHKRAQKFLDTEMLKNEEDRNPKLIERLMKKLGW